MTLNLTNPSQQILAPWTSRGRPPLASPELSLKILFDHLEDFLIWCLGDAQSRPSREVPGKMFSGFPWRTFKGYPIGIMWGLPLDDDDDDDELFLWYGWPTKDV